MLLFNIRSSTNSNIMKSVGKLERTGSEVPSVLAFNQTAPDANNISESFRILFRYTIVIQCIVVLRVNLK